MPEEGDGVEQLTRVWCHICSAVQFCAIPEDNEPECPQCNGNFIEVLAEDEARAGAQDQGLGSELAPVQNHARIQDEMGVYLHNTLQSITGTDAQLQVPVMSSSGAMFGEGGNIEVSFDGNLMNLLNLGGGGNGFGSFDQIIDHLAANDPNRYETPTDRSFVEALVSEEVRAVEGTDSSGVDCAVCKEELEVGAAFKRLPCDHCYCPECILPWLATHNSCPVCRYKLPAAS
mmetsp:Transcript_12616/g.21351  ORF Transcript_12616/g.21351 Transcript_12616/m.21351 type:complete len:231 (+) Transcript_12616:386-1078(+)